MLGVFFLSMAGVVGLSILIAAVFYYKMQWVGLRSCLDQQASRWWSLLFYRAFSSVIRKS